jgi:glyoxylase-like metal-dependent hydrolase (beta-lactamase superfamily II)
LKKIQEGAYSIHTIDCHYMADGFACAYLLIEDGRAVFIENNTVHALPYLMRALSDHGILADQVEFLIVTHLHLDHAGGTSALLRECPNAMVLCHPKATRHIIDPSRLVSGSVAVYGEDHFRKLYGEILPIEASRVRAMGDGEVLEFGSRRFSFIHTKGHATHHFCIHDSASGGIFTGDAFGLAYPILQRGTTPFIFPTTAPSEFDGEDARRSVEKIIASGADHAYLTHFGIFADIRDGARQLTRALDTVALIAADADAAGIKGDSLEAFCWDRFQEFFNGALYSRGLMLAPEDLNLLEVDLRLNGRGIAQYIEKKRGSAH